MSWVMGGVETKSIDQPLTPVQPMDVNADADFAKLPWKLETEIKRVRDVREPSGSSLLSTLSKMQATLVNLQSLRTENGALFSEDAAIERHLFVPAVGMSVDVFGQGLWSIGGKIIGMRDKDNKDLSDLTSEELEMEKPAYVIVKFQTEGKAEVLAWPLQQCRLSANATRLMNGKLCELQRALGLVHGRQDFAYYKVGPGAVICWVDADTVVPKSMSEVASSFLRSARVESIDLAFNVFTVWSGDRWVAVPFECVADICFAEVEEEGSLLATLLRPGRTRKAVLQSNAQKARSPSKSASSTATSKSKPKNPKNPKAKATMSKEEKGVKRIMESSVQAVSALEAVNDAPVAGAGLASSTLTVNILEHEGDEEDEERGLNRLDRSVSEHSHSLLTDKSEPSHHPDLAVDYLRQIQLRIEQLERSVFACVRKEAADAKATMVRVSTETESRLTAKLDLISETLRDMAVPPANPTPAASMSSKDQAKEDERKRKRKEAQERKNAAAKGDKCVAALQPNLNAHEKIIIDKMEKMMGDGWSFPPVVTDREFRGLRQMSRAGDQWRSRDYSQIWPLLSMFADSEVLDGGAERFEATMCSMQVGTHSIWYIYRSALNTSDGADGQGLTNWLRAYLTEGLKAGVIHESFCRSLPEALECAQRKIRKDNAMDFFHTMTSKPKGKREFQPLVAAIRVFRSLFARDGFIR